jgi:phosphopantothenoylcysteine decarboxylase / phosphopantothenate---cysteine ligase
MRTKRGVHPSKDIRGTEGSELEGKKIVLCITGSVAAYRAIDLARLLMRHDADVHAVMTESSASMLLNPEIMKWATGNDVVSKLTGNLEHIMLADYGMSDLIIVYPCTANTLGKVVAGIDDTPVTSVLSVALGSKIPIIVAPAMHEAMYENIFVQ